MKAWRHNIIAKVVSLLVLIAAAGSLAKAEAAAWQGDWLYRPGMVPQAYERVTDGQWLPEPGTASEAWRKFDYPGPPSLADGVHWVALSRTISPAEVKDNTLTFATTNESVRLWLGERLIYEYGHFRDVPMGDGYRWHIVVLPEFYSPAQLTFELYSNSPYQLGVVENLGLSTEMEAVQTLFWQDVPNLMAIPVCLLLMVIMLLYHHFTSRKDRKLYFAIVGFLGIFSLWLLCAAKLTLLVFDAPVFWWYALSILAYLLPISGNLIVYEVLRDEPDARMDIVVGAEAVLLAIAMAGEAMGLHLMNRMMALYYPMLLVSESAAAYWLWRKAAKGDYRARALICSVAAFTLCGVADGLAGHFHLWSQHSFVTPFAVLSFCYFVFVIIGRQLAHQREMAARQADLEYEAAVATEKAERDPLTGCYNRQRLDELASESLNASQREHLPMSVLLLDIDHFKQINDEFGHSAGDKVLKDFTAVIRQALDRSKPFIRWGGEEFLVFCPQLGMKEALDFAEKLRRLVSARKLGGVDVTCSIGVAVWHGRVDSFQALFKRVDQALYMAKNAGRNCVRLEGGKLPELYC